MRTSNEKIGVIGLGHVGLTFAAVAINVGYHVVGMDLDSSKVGHLKMNREPNILEPGLSETLKRNKEKIIFTSAYDVVCKTCSTLVLCVGTPLNGVKTVDTSSLDRATEAIGKYLRKGQLIILRSTVPPGTTQEVSLRLEKQSGLRCGNDFYVAYSPERTIEGLALYENYTLPKIVGGVNPESLAKAVTVLSRLGGKIVKVSSPTSAELCKFVDNLYRSLNIAFANEVGLICEKTGVDSHEIVEAVNNAYERTHIFLPGLGADGPCLTKDPIILDNYAETIGVHLGVVKATIARNIESTKRISSIVHDFISTHGIKKPRIAFLGLSFKGFPETEDTRGSPALMLLEELKQSQTEASFSFFDPIVHEISGAKVSTSLEHCIEGSNAILILTNHPSFCGLGAGTLVDSSARPLLIVDCWGVVSERERLPKDGVSLFRIGDGTRGSWLQAAPAS